MSLRGVPGGQRPPGERLFVAIVPPAAALAHLAAAVDAARAGRPAGASPLRWSPPERWHLTVAFLGDVPPEDVPTIGVGLDRAVAGVAGFDCQLTGSGTFGSGRGGGVLWVGVTGTGLALAAGRVRAALSIEAASFRPHVTLARWRGDARAASAMAAGLRQYAGPRWPVRCIELIRSHLGPVPRYDTVERWPLGHR